MTIRVRDLGLTDYVQSLAAMRQFVAADAADALDELWLVQHPRVFTQGQGGRPQHVHDCGDIPLVKSDRGGQVTYHGPGQLVVYTLLDLRRLQLGPRELVGRIEQAIINLLAELSIDGRRRDGAPGVYVDEAKIAALGLRIKNGKCYHGLALNVDVDLAPFNRIDPCGYSGLEVTRLRDLDIELDCDEVAQALVPHLIASLFAEAQAIDWTSEVYTTQAVVADHSQAVCS